MEGFGAGMPRTVRNLIAAAVGEEARLMHADMVGTLAMGMVVEVHNLVVGLDHRRMVMAAPPPNSLHRTMTRSTGLQWVPSAVLMPSMGPFK